jgi:hypothetical protein
MLFGLGCRYWIHILLPDGAVNQEHPCFSSWKDSRSKDSMFTSEQVKEWDWEHLLGCHWYIEMPFSSTPPHEVNNRQTVESDFQMPLSTGPNITHVEEQTKGRTGKPKVKSSTQSTKRGLPAEGPEASKRSKTVVDEVAQHDPEEITLTQSEARSSRAVSQTTLSHGGGNDWGGRTSVVSRDTGGQEFFELLLNTSVESLLANSELLSKFQKFAIKVCNLQLVSEICHYLS